MADLVLRVAVILFSIIQALLGLRLISNLIEVPSGLVQYVPTLFALTDPLITPFVEFAALLGVEVGALPIGPVGSGLFDRLDGSVVLALVGWSLIELIVVMVLRVTTRAS